MRKTRSECFKYEVLRNKVYKDIYHKAVSLKKQNIKSKRTSYARSQTQSGKPTRLSRFSTIKKYQGQSTRMIGKAM